MSSVRGTYMRSGSHIVTIWRYIRSIADMNELSEMPAVALERFRINRRLKTWN